MDTKTKNKVTLALLIIVSMLLTLYVAGAHYVASFVYELYGQLWRPDTVGGEFYPWPYRPSGLAGMVLTPLDQFDAQYYLYVIKPGVIIYLTAAMWATVFFQTLKIRRLGRVLENNNGN